MPLSLFQPQFNATLFQNYYHLNDVPSGFPPPVAPDSYGCESWYAHPQPATVEDCHLALNLLPSGTEVEPFSYHFPADDPNRLPLLISHGEHPLRSSISLRYIESDRYL